ncbi:hypothetical protein BSL82_09735 [Tardibacter chloracetimidivorans]|uniref:Helix-turn-helix domain-containing protein n=1 Tax=Tardibacter chloracetimidivorans TaxID=1921510 RepID=A0A1L3ZVD6_9SPHN|nr:hypothetical protein BSL82_09735 [Tardibacter chloracetimidivorans]
MSERQERVRIGELARMTGKTVRALQAMALRGEIPGCAKIGREWTFDRIKVRRWIIAAEAETCQKTYTSVAKSTGSRYRWPVSSIDEAYERALSQ